MIRAIPLLLMLLLLPGCATLGVELIAGLVGGAAHFGGKKAAEAGYKKWQREQRCNKLRTPVYRERCLNRLRYMQGTT
jgi:hypothetical protein